MANRPGAWKKFPPTFFEFTIDKCPVECYTILNKGTEDKQMANVIWIIVLLVCFLLNWEYAEETGSKFSYVAMICCGVAVLLKILELGRL